MPGDKEERIAKYMAMEKAVHPWADDALLRRIVEDEIAQAPSYYDEEGEEGYGGSQGHAEEEEDDDGEPPMKGGKPGLKIVIR